MQKYIAAEDLRRAISELSFVGYLNAGDIHDAVEWLPVFELKKGHWVSDEDGNIKCSECGQSGVGDNYCEHCGADMRDENGNISIEYPRIEEYDAEIH